jgi:hypothetical protein
MKLLDLVIEICFLNYLEWTISSMCNTYLETGFLHKTCGLCSLSIQLVPCLATRPVFSQNYTFLSPVLVT